MEATDKIIKILNINFIKLINENLSSIRNINYYFNYLILSPFIFATSFTFVKIIEIIAFVAFREFITTMYYPIVQ